MQQLRVHMPHIKIPWATMNIWWSQINVSQLSRSVMSNSLQPHGLEHARLPCSSPTPRAYSNSCLSCRWCHPTISSSVIPFSSHLNLSQHQGLFQWVSSLHQVTKGLEFQLQHQPWYSGLISFRMDWLDLLEVQGLLRVFSNTTVQKHQFFGAQLSLWSNSHIHSWLLEKP